MAPAAGAIGWQVLAHGAAVGSAVLSPRAYVALKPITVELFAPRLSHVTRVDLASVDFSKDAVVAIFGEFGCSDKLISVTSIEQRGQTLAVTLLQQLPKPGTAQCMALFPTYRVLLIAKSSLRPPYPTRATVTLARA